MAGLTSCGNRTTEHKKVWAEWAWMGLCARLSLLECSVVALKVEWGQMGLLWVRV